MGKLELFRALRRALFALALAGAPGQAAAAAYRIVIDSKDLAGSGWLDLQFNPGRVPATGATAALTGFTGALGGGWPPQISGQVSNALPGSVLFGNGDSYNDLFQAVTFGGKFFFDVDFGGAFLNTPGQVGTSFTASLLGADQSTLLGHYDAVTGSLLKFDLTPARGGAQFGSVDLQVFDSNRVSVSPVPEPSQWLMLLGGILFVGLVARRKFANGPATGAARADVGLVARRLESV